MPLTPFQHEVLSVIVSNRSPASHFAGGLVFNHPPDSPRFSKDFDIFHEAAEQVQVASEADAESLRVAGFTVSPTREWLEPSTFRKARVSRGNDHVDIDWAADSAVRFFPIEADDLLGWRLHFFDALTNKALAMAARSETRDMVDIVKADTRCPLEAVVWAACGKDPGYNPQMLLGYMRRFSRVDAVTLDKITAGKGDPVELKRQWLEMALRTGDEIKRVHEAQPDLEIGVAFVDENNVPGWIGTNPALKIHRPTVGGCWPRFSEDS